MSIPHLFRCPISLDLFTDPVTLSTGQTYDRPSIERWLAGGHRTCPVTMQRLDDTTLVPNHTLRQLIEQWFLAGPGATSRRPKLSEPESNMEFSLAALKHNIQSEAVSAATKLEALNKVRILSVESDIGRAYLIQLGFFPLLLQTLFQSPSELAELVLDCVLSLSPSTQLQSLNILKDDSTMDSMVLLLEKGSIKIKCNLCHLLETITTSSGNQELALIIGQSQHIMQKLVFLLHEKSDADVGPSEAAVRAMAAICSTEANRANAIREGSISALIKYLTWSSANKRSASSKALATLEYLVGLEAGRRAMARISNAVPVIVKNVFMVSGDKEGSEHATGVLLMVCRDSAQARDDASAAGVVTQLLLLLQSQCSSRAKARARALLKMLRST